MALVNRSFSVNITPGMMPPVVHVSEYDVGRAYTVSILDEQGNTFTIPSGTTASIEGTLNGSVGFTQSATISNNQVSFTLTESMTAYSGKAWCKIKLTQNSQPIQTCAFVLAIDRAGVEAETVIGAPGFEEQIAEAAGAWLEEQGFQSPTVDVTEITGGHRVTVTDYQGSESFDVMDGEDTGVVTDATLTQEGAAADAKAVGDILYGASGSQSVRDITANDYSVISKCLSADGKWDTSVQSGVVPIGTNDTAFIIQPQASGGQNFLYGFLINTDGNNNQAANFAPGQSRVTLTAGSEQTEIAVPSGAAVLCFTLSTSGGASRLPIVFKAKSEVISNDGLVGKVEELETTVSGMSESVSSLYESEEVSVSTWVIGKRINDSGEEVTASTSAYSDGYIQAKGCRFSRTGDADNGNGAEFSYILHEYDNRGTWLRSTDFTNQPVGVGNDCTVCKIVFKAQAGSGVVMSQEIIDEFFGVEKIVNRLDTLDQRVTQLENSGGGGSGSRSESIAFLDYTARSGTIISDGTWGTAGTSILIPIPSWAESVALQANASGNSYYAFLRSEGTTRNPEYSSGETTRHAFSNGETVEVEVPTDAAYLYLAKTSSSGANLLPQSGTFSSAESEDEGGGDSGDASWASKTKEVVPSTWGQANALARIKQFCDIQYTLVAAMPYQNNTTRAAGKYTGLPYSSVRWIDKYIGQDVSIHTFMTAVHNPRSVVYTRRSPTTNSGAYYGTVCSQIVNYAWGLEMYRVGRLMLSPETDLGYPLHDYDHPEYIFDKVHRVTVHQVQVGDMLADTEHFLIISGVKRDAVGRVTHIRVAESAQSGCIWHDYITTSAFLQTYGMKEIWRYDKIDDVSYPQSDYVKGYPDETLPTVNYPDIMCEYGDRAVIPAGEDVVINVVDAKSYTAIRVYKDGTLIDTKNTVADFTISNIAYGTYKVELTDGSNTSSSEFVAVDMQCSFDPSTKIVSFASTNAAPRAVTYYVSSGGNRAWHDLTAAEVSAGQYDCTKLLEIEPTSQNVKVYFHHAWGNVAWHNVDIFASGGGSGDDDD